jgi:hypothetical protein
MALRQSDGTIIGSLAAQSLNGDKTPYQLWLEGGHTGTEADYQASLQGRSAYQLWLDAGNVGTEAQYLASLAGSSGKSAYQSWKDLGNSGTEAQFIASLKGADGASAHPLLVTGLTGGEVGSLAVRSSINPNVLVDVSPADIDDLFPSSLLYYRHTPTDCYSPGGLVPGNFSAADVGKLVALNDKTADAASNLVVYPKGTVPVELVASASRVFLRAGQVESVGNWRFLPAEPVADFSTSLQLFENFASVPNGTAPPDTLLKEQWETANQTLSVVVDAGTEIDWPFDRYFQQLTTSGSRRALALMGAGLVKDAPMRLTFAVPVGQDMNNRAVRVLGRVTGSGGTLTAVVADLNLGTGRLKFFTYKDGAGSVDLKATAGNAITGGAFAPLLGNTLYTIDFWPAGNRLLARAYLYGSTPPLWQISTFQTTVLAPGRPAFSGATGALDLRAAFFAVTTNYGPLKTAP